MSTVQQPARTAPPVVAPTRRTPRLENGDRLTRVEFERRYEAMPDVRKAQLIEGIVYMPSPVRGDVHAKPHFDIISILGYYRLKTPGVIGYDNASLKLDGDNEPQPDVMLVLPKHVGGTAWMDAKGYVCGVPELVCEVAASTASIDLNDKLDAYRRNGVREYLVLRTEDKAVDWFDLVEGKYVAKALDNNGYLRSKLFPGLWLDPAALLATDMAKVMAAIDEGIASDEHREFVNKLQRAEPE